MSASMRSCALSTWIEAVVVGLRQHEFEVSSCDAQGVPEVVGDGARELLEAVVRPLELSLPLSVRRHVLEQEHVPRTVGCRPGRYVGLPHRDRSLADVDVDRLRPFERRVDGDEFVHVRVAQVCVGVVRQQVSAPGVRVDDASLGVHEQIPVPHRLDYARPTRWHEFEHPILDDRDGEDAHPDRARRGSDVDTGATGWIDARSLQHAGEEWQQERGNPEEPRDALHHGPPRDEECREQSGTVRPGEVEHEQRGELVFEREDALGGNHFGTGNHRVPGIQREENEEHHWWHQQEADGPSRDPMAFADVHERQHHGQCCVREQTQELELVEQQRCRQVRRCSLADCGEHPDGVVEAEQRDGRDERTAAVRLDAVEAVTRHEKRDLPPE